MQAVGGAKASLAVRQHGDPEIVRNRRSIVYAVSFNNRSGLGRAYHVSRHCVSDG